MNLDPLIRITGSISQVDKGCCAIIVMAENLGLTAVAVMEPDQLTTVVHVEKKEFELFWYNVRGGLQRAGTLPGMTVERIQ